MLSSSKDMALILALPMQAISRILFFWLATLQHSIDFPATLYTVIEIFKITVKDAADRTVRLHAGAEPNASAGFC